uniref:Uncharacterized protein n=1 Tax=Glossina brevipalpis TaxID=37001 RepID=A0A1A9WWD3_9MUSC
MQDNTFILRLMYDLNIMPLALQITNICGYIMTHTLQSQRSQRHEYLLLHPSTRKNHIVPDKRKRDHSSTGENDTIMDDAGDLSQWSVVLWKSYLNIGTPKTLQVLRKQSRRL